MRAIIGLVLVSVLSGCATGIAFNYAPPGVDEFPPQELPFRVAGDNDAVLRRIQDYIVSRGLPSVVTVRAPKTYVVTTYVEEPRKPEDRRFRRTAFRFALSPIQAAAPCTSAAVVALTKSRGVREEIWAVQDSDTTYISSVWPDIKAFLEKEPCR
jgi:hypothetical protein